MESVWPEAVVAVAIFICPIFELHWDYTYEMVETAVSQNALKFKRIK